MSGVCNAAGDSILVLMSTTGEGDYQCVTAGPVRALGCGNGTFKDLRSTFAKYA